MPVRHTALTISQKDHHRNLVDRQNFSKRSPNGDTPRKHAEITKATVHSEKGFREEKEEGCIVSRSNALLTER